MMGRHHGRLCQSLDVFDFVGAVDPQGDQYGVIHQGQVFSDTESLLKEGIEAAVIAVPTHLHYETAMQLREAGIHVLIEKPLAGTTEEAAEIVEAFEGSGLIAAVGHVERCNPALNEMKQRLNKEQLGPVFSISTVRTGPFPARITDVGVVKDLATHDIDIVRWLAGEIHEIHSVTKHKMGRQHEDLMVAAGLMEFEKIQVLDITNGNRLETYVIKGKRGSGEVCINGAAAHLVKKGDLVIIVAYCQLIDNVSLNHKPKIVYVDGENKIIPKPSKEKIYL